MLAVTILYAGGNMTSNTRACIALIAASICNDQNYSSIYDYTQSKHLNINGNADSNHVSIYDYDRGCYVQGSPESLYDYGNNAHIQLNINNQQFSGYDYHTSSNYSGNVNGTSVSIYDHDTSQHHNYSV